MKNWKPQPCSFRPLSERLGEKLLASVDTPLEYEDEWADVADRRIQELLDGTVKPVPGDEVLRAAVERLTQ